MTLSPINEIIDITSKLAAIATLAFTVWRAYRKEFRRMQNDSNSETRRTANSGLTPRQREINSSGSISAPRWIGLLLCLAAFANLFWFIFGPPAPKPLTGHDGAIIALALIQFYLAFKF